MLRITEQSRQFIALVFARSAGTLVLRLVFVVGLGLGVLGVVVADIVMTAIFTVVISPWFTPLIRPVFSWPVMREALGFGLPRIPHSIAHQVIGLADRYFLNAFGTLRDVGLYSIGASFGLALKLFLSAFEVRVDAVLSRRHARTGSRNASTAPCPPTSSPCSCC